MVDKDTHARVLPYVEDLPRGDYCARSTPESEARVCQGMARSELIASPSQLFLTHLPILERMDNIDVIRSSSPRVASMDSQITLTVTAAMSPQAYT